MDTAFKVAHLNIMVDPRGHGEICCVAGAECAMIVDLVGYLTGVLMDEWVARGSNHVIRSRSMNADR